MLRPMQPGSVIAGKYRLLRLLGEGAMGVVWAAVHELTEREVAVKLISREHAANDEIRARMMREARACGRIAHRNVLEILDVGETATGEPFLVMPLLTGETLATVLARSGRLPASSVVRIATEIAKGLAAAHTAGIVHRDLKPANLFLVDDDDTNAASVKIVDFGVSKILTSQDASATATGSALGSPAYMSPEQARGERTIDHRSDIWSLGVVMFEALAGSRPFHGDTPYAVVADILHGRIPSLLERAPDVDPRLATLVGRCLERDIRNRISSAGELIAELKAVSTPETSTGPGSVALVPPSVVVPAVAVSAPAVAQSAAAVQSAPGAPSVTSTTPVTRSGPGGVQPSGSGSGAVARGPLDEISQLASSVARDPGRTRIALAAVAALAFVGFGVGAVVVAAVLRGSGAQNAASGSVSVEPSAVQPSEAPSAAAPVPSPAVEPVATESASSAPEPSTPVAAAPPGGKGRGAGRPPPGAKQPAKTAAPPPAKPPPPGPAPTNPVRL
jgi:serine/threonine-protein kinase